MSVIGLIGQSSFKILLHGGEIFIMLVGVFRALIIFCSYYTLVTLDPARVNAVLFAEFG